MFLEEEKRMKRLRKRTPLYVRTPELKVNGLSSSTQLR